MGIQPLLTTPPEKKYMSTMIRQRRLKVGHWQISQELTGTTNVVLIAADRLGSTGEVTVNVKSMIRR
jgi:hypothetical protein